LHKIYFYIRFQILFYILYNVESEKSTSDSVNIVGKKLLF